MTPERAVLVDDLPDPVAAPEPAYEEHLPGETRAVVERAKRDVDDDGSPPHARAAVNPRLAAPLLIDCREVRSDDLWFAELCVAQGGLRRRADWVRGERQKTAWIKLDSGEAAPTDRSSPSRSRPGCGGDQPSQQTNRHASGQQPDSRRMHPRRLPLNREDSRLGQCSGMTPERR